MHDIRLIRDDPAAFDAALTRRGLAPLSGDILALDSTRRARIAAAETALAERNAASKQVGAAKARGDEPEFERLRALVAAKKDEIGQLESQAAHADAELQDLLQGVPNLPLADVPDGPDESANVELHRWGSPRNFATPPLEHYQIPAARAGLDFEAAGRLSGSRFVVMKGAMIRLHRALAQFMLDTHIEKNGLTEVWTPVLVRDEAMYGTGQLPKFAEDSYQTTNGWWLIPTAEVTLTNLVAGQILEESQLPIRMTAHTQCFRSEAGSAGKDTAGMLRQHQFEKVEMVSIVRPEDARDELDRMTRCAEGILEAPRPPLPHRRPRHRRHGLRRPPHPRPRGLAARPGHFPRDLLGLALRRLPGPPDERPLPPRRGRRPEFVHTLNGSGLAVGRTLIAVLENGQEEDGSVTLPPALAPYLRGATRSHPRGRPRLA